MTTAHRLARCIALPAVFAGILGGAALGLAGMANAGTYPRPGIVAKPSTIARPPVTVIPGKRWHRDHIVIEMPAGE